MSGDMTAYWTGPFSTSDIPAGQRITGWSNWNENSSTNALFNRYRDGDPVSAFAWRELYENLNLHYNQDRRLVWADVWDGLGFAAGSVQTGGVTTWVERGAIRTISPEILTLHTFRRGDDAMGRLSVRLRIKTSSLTHEVTARVYSVPTFEECWNLWPAYAAVASSANYAQFTSTTATYPTAPGWTDTKEITSPRASEHVITFDDGRKDVSVYTTHLVLATIENAQGTEAEVGAIQVHEEAPGG